MPDDISSNFAIEEDTAAVAAVHGVSAEETEDTTDTPPLWKQAVGALVGSALALLLYGAYSVASPVVTAWLTPDDTVTERHTAPVSAAARKQRTQVQE